MRWTEEVAAARWIVDRMHPFARDVGSLVPDTFPAYARILHPALRVDPPPPAPVTWSELASQARVELTPTIQFSTLATRLPAGTIDPPQTGTLDGPQLEALLAVLSEKLPAAHTCWFAVWDGYGWLTGYPAVAALEHGSAARGLPGAIGFPAARLSIPGRSYALYEGPLAEARALSTPVATQSPNLWWPDDRSWCVASEIDLDSTYVGGSAALIRQLLGDERLDTLPAETGDAIGQ